MRASPAFQISLHRFGVWRGAVLVLAALAASSMAAWVLTRAQPVGAAPVIAAVLAGAVLAWLAGSSMRSPAALRWDGERWHLGVPASSPDAAVPGDLAVTIDLGPWMLLRFEPAAGVGLGSRRIWLPVQRRGIEAQWHALRCAVYSPRPTPGPDTAAGL